MRACAPGKIILSGEHSVVFGAQAIAVAINKHTTVSFKPLTESNTINTLFSGISSGVHYPLNALGTLKEKLDSRFESFAQGLLPIQKILNTPDDLLVYTLSSLVHHLPVPGRASSHSYLPIPGRLSSTTELSLGAGMGSSASAIAATLVLFEHLLEKPLSVDQRFDMVRFCERLQHGRGSAIDAAAVTYGGMNHIQNGVVKRLDVSLGSDWYWIFTGKPQVSTGECVHHVRSRHEKDTLLWQAFSEVTASIVDNLDNLDSLGNRNNHQAMIDAIKENHRLLCRIGVVPVSAVALINTLEASGGAAKISGAGAHKGDAGGLVLAYLPEGSIQDLLKKYPGYQWGIVEEDALGARYIGD
jgi:mevalonate kinase